MLQAVNRIKKIRKKAFEDMCKFEDEKNINFVTMKEAMLKICDKSPKDILEATKLLADGVKECIKNPIFPLFRQNNTEQEEKNSVNLSTENVPAPKYGTENQELILSTDSSTGHNVEQPSFSETFWGYATAAKNFIIDNIGYMSYIAPTGAGYMSVTCNGDEPLLSNID